MATESSKTATTAPSPESYIGSLLSITSKSEIRYEGVLIHLDVRDTTIGLQNVRSFGTEGRRRDGYEVPASNRVYESVYFRGTDIKDLKVLSAPTVQSTPTIHDDPAIISSHYLPPASPSRSTSLPPAATGSTTSFCSNAQLGLPGSTFQGSLDQYQPAINAGSWSSSLPPNLNSNEHIMPMYCQGFNAPSDGVSSLQQQSLPQSSLVLAVSPSPQQHVQYSMTNASLPGGSQNFPEFSHPVLQPFSNGSQNLMSTMIPSSTLPMNLPIHLQYSVTNASLPGGSPNFPEFPHPVLQPFSNCSSDLMSTMIPSSTLPMNLSIGGYASLASYKSPNQMETNAPTLPPITLTSSLSMMSPLTSSSLDSNTIIHQIVDKPEAVLGSNSPYQSEPISVPCIVGTSGAKHTEASIPSLVTPGQLLQSGPIELSSSNALKTADKDIEVVQAATSESPSTGPKDASVANLPLKSPHLEKPNRVPLHSQHQGWENEQGRRNMLSRTTPRSQHEDRGHVQGRRDGLHATNLHARHVLNSHARGREHKDKGSDLHTHHSNGVHAWGRGNRSNNEPALHSHYPSRNHVKGRGNMTSQWVTKFTEDFDFVAMNEKFNKDEVWDQLGKGNKAKINDKGNANGSDEDSVSSEDGDVPSKVEIRPVYIKDDFFDSLSCNSLSLKSKKGRVKFSEQMRMDRETVGNFRMNRGACAGRGPGRGGQRRGSHFGRDSGHAGRGQEWAMWSRVT